MSAKILVADDSLTIQKVVGITLAESGYELDQCKSESELYEKVKNNHYDLILLDFNLSESKSGYELSKDILKASPDVSILVMLGTFDTVDDSQLEEVGVKDKIVKPFESVKFIQKCTELIENSEYEESDDFRVDAGKDQEEEPVEEVESTDADEDDLDEKTEEILLHSDEYRSDDDVENESALEEGAEYFKQEADEELIEASEGWVVDSPSRDDESLLDNSGGLWEEEEGEPQLASSDSKLESEIESWGMDVPGIIGGTDLKQSLHFPPVIEEGTSLQVEELQDIASEAEAEEEEVQIPDRDDLDYPSVDEPARGPKSKLISMDELSVSDDDEEEDDEELDVTDPLIQRRAPIQDDIAHEIENEISPDEFWAVDEKGSGNTDLTISEYIDGAGANPDISDMSESRTDLSDMNPNQINNPLKLILMTKFWKLKSTKMKLLLQSKSL